MRSIGDFHKIKEHEKSYINRPLSFLLKDIQPTITFVLPSPSEDNSVRLGTLIFKFQDTTTMESIRKRGKQPISIAVFVKETFTWDFSTRSPEEKFIWTKADADRLANLTVLGIRVSGVTE